MAVNWGSLIFGGVDSSEYGIYLSGEGVYNAPERAVAVVDVPGRNGAVLIDQGHWNNIEVVYKAGVFGANQETFSEKLSAFRNAILSQTGYQRLSDTYHPEEFRMGAYVSGLEVSPASYNRHGEFELIFNCKPQRWLVDGDLPIPLDSGDVLENPTEYDSSPLLRISGYGHIGFNGYDIDISSTEPLGEVALSESGIFPSRFDSSGGTGSIVNTYETIINLYTDLLVNGDEFYLPYSDDLLSAFTLKCYLKTKTGYTLQNITYSSVSTGLIVDLTTRTNNQITINVGFDPDTIQFVKGTDKSYSNLSFTVNGTIDNTAFYFIYRSNLVYDSSQKTLTVTQKIYTYGSDNPATLNYWQTASSYKGVSIMAPVTGISTLPAYGDLVIDCDLGEAWKVVDGELTPLNAIIDLGSDLPTLAPGMNTVTFDNTISVLTLAPRWWKL